MGYLANWDDMTQYDNITIPEELRNMTRAHLDWQLQNCEAPKFDYRIQAVSTPAKDQLATVGSDDVAKFITSKKSDDDDWKDVQAKYEKGGVRKAIEEVNAKAKELGIN